MKNEGKVVYKLGVPVKHSVKPHARMKSAVWIIVCVVFGVVSTYHPAQAANGTGPDIGPAPIPVIVRAVELPQTALVPQATVEPMLYPVKSGLTNSYTWGNCTAYVASKLPVPGDWGNAVSWGYQAAAQGYEVSDLPKVGTIAWSITDSYLGHVAIVEAVNGGQVIISEMNYQGLGVVDTRVANPGEFRYIYL